MHFDQLNNEFEGQNLDFPKIASVLDLLYSRILYTVYHGFGEAQLVQNSYWQFGFKLEVIFPAALKYDTRFKSGQNRLKNNHLAPLVKIRDTLITCRTLCFRRLSLIRSSRYLNFSSNTKCLKLNFDKNLLLEIITILIFVFVQKLITINHSFCHFISCCRRKKNKREANLLGVVSSFKPELSYLVANRHMWRQAF